MNTFWRKYVKTPRKIRKAPTNLFCFLNCRAQNEVYILHCREHLYAQVQFVEMFFCAFLKIPMDGGRVY